MSGYSDYIKQVGDEIKEEIERDNLVSDFCSFEDNSITDVINTNLVRQLKDRRIPYERKLVSHCKYTQALVFFVKRIIRKVLYFLIQPIVDDINDNQLLIAFALEDIDEYLIARAPDEALLKKLGTEIVALKAENRRLWDALEQLQSEKA